VYTPSQVVTGVTDCEGWVLKVRQKEGRLRLASA
jgi:hypothetical protein